MTETLLVLAQFSPGANLLNTLYTVPGSTTTVLSSITICNQNATSQTFSISIAVAGATDATKQYLYYQLPLAANDTFVASIGVTLAATDVVRCWANNANVSFQLFGVQNS